MTFDDCWARHVVFDINGIAVPFIAVEDLIANKRAAGRPQDLADAVALADPSEADRRGGADPAAGR